MNRLTEEQIQKYEECRKRLHKIAERWGGHCVEQQAADALADLLAELRLTQRALELMAEDSNDCNLCPKAVFRECQCDDVDTPACVKRLMAHYRKQAEEEDKDA